MLTGEPTALDDTYAVPIDNPLVVDSSTTTAGARITQIVPTGIPGFGAALIPGQSLLMRFEVSGPVRTARIGGFLFSYEPGTTVFGAIVALTGPEDFPDSVNLSTPDVLGHTLIPLSEELIVHSGELSVELSEGWYGLVIGGGRLGASGQGVAPSVMLDQNFTHFSQEGGWSPLPNHAFQFFVDAEGVRGGVLDNDSDPEGFPLSASVETPPEHGALVLDPDGTFTYTPEPGFTDIDSFRYSVSNGTSQSSATAWLGRPHAPPIASNDRYEVNEGQSLAGASVLANDLGENLDAVLVAGPETGTLVFNSDGTFVYTSEVGRVESDRFLYRVRSGTLWSAPATVTLDIRDVNIAPDANDDLYRIEPDETLMSGEGTRLASAIYFTDESHAGLNRISLEDGAFERFRSLSWPPSSIALDLPNNMVYWAVRAPEYAIYRASLDGGPQQLIVQMPAVEYVDHHGHTRRDPPSVWDLAIDVAGGKLYWVSNAVGDYPSKVSRSNLDGSNIEDLWTSPDTYPSSLDLDLKARKVYWTDGRDILRTDMEAPRTTESILPGAMEIALDVSHGHIYFGGNAFHGGGGTISRANLDGSSAEGITSLHGDSFLEDLAVDPARGKIYWSDGRLDTINRVNFDSTGREVLLRNGLTNPYGFALDQIFPDNYVYGLLANDSDADNDGLTATVVTDPQHGLLELQADGSFKYVPNAGFVGRDTFTYRAKDGELDSELATVTIQVGNAVPVANPETYDIQEDQVLEKSAAEGVLANDVDDGASLLTAVLLSEPSHGTLYLAPDGAFFYRPNDTFFGEDSFVYQADDGENRSEPTTVTIRVAEVNDAPVARRDEITGQQGQTISFPASRLTENDFDPEGDSLNVTAVAATANTQGTVSLAGGVVTYRPEPAFSGIATFSYTVSDGNGGQSVGTVEVDVASIAQNTAGKAQGHGTLDRARRLFSFNVQSHATNSGHRIQGHLSYVDFQVGFYFRSTQITSFRIEPDGRVASFSGVGMLSGRRGFAFTVHLEDIAGPNRGRDKFRIEISGRGVDYDSLDRAVNGGRIDRLGDIRVQPSRPVIPRAFLRPHDLVMAAWTNEGHHETLVQQLAKRRLGQ